MQHGRTGEERGGEQSNYLESVAESDDDENERTREGGRMDRGEDGDSRRERERERVRLRKQRVDWIGSKRRNERTNDPPQLSFQLSIEGRMRRRDGESATGWNWKGQDEQ